ncbi:unnamed protein product, partial [Phaeothamnion confervicola]
GGGGGIERGGKGVSNQDTSSRVLHCIVGGVRSEPALVESDRMLSCVTPRAPIAISDGGGVVTVSVTGNGGADASAAPGTFSYVQSPTLTGLFPGHVDERGGIVVSVYGSGFIPGPNLSCRFGGLEIVSAEWISPGEVACVTPPAVNGPGAVSVEISDDGTSFLSAAGLSVTYLRAFTVASAKPVSGPACGGTTVVISGGG